MPDNMFIELNGIEYSYPDGTEALKGIDLKIERGQKVAFLGANGSGKSSLFLLLAGMVKPAHGEYLLNDGPVKWTAKWRRILSKTIGFVFQDPDVQLLCNTVYKEVAYGPANFGLKGSELQDRVQWAMQECGIVPLADKTPHALSFGQKKNVSIASILAMNTEAIIFDEPLAWLDHQHKQNMLKTLNMLHAKGKTLIVSTHNADFAYQWADIIYIVHEGQIIDKGAPSYIFGQEESIRKAKLAAPLAYHLSNLTGMAVSTEEEMLQLLVKQLKK